MCLTPPRPLDLSRLRAKLSKSEVPIDRLADCTGAVLPVMSCDLLIYQSSLGKYVFKPGAVWFQARTPHLDSLLREFRESASNRSLFVGEWECVTKACLECCVARLCEK